MTTRSDLEIVTYRGGHAETRHGVAYSVVSVEGETLSGGSSDQPMFGRSSTKPLQALPLVASGAADAFDLTPTHLALACASHSGESRHVEAVNEWLERIDCSPDDLECGVMHPFSPEQQRKLAQTGSEPTLPHHMCSGKHTGFLTLARHLGVDPAGYTQPEHPVQVEVSRAIAATTGADLSTRPLGVDGCSIPTHATTCTELATAMLTLIEPSTGPDEFAAAGPRIASAMSAHPEFVGGLGRLDSQIMAAFAANAGGPQVFAKTGATGVFVAGVTDPTGPSHAIALKVIDGATVAAETAVMAILSRLGYDPAALDASLTDRLEIRTVRGASAGSIAAEWSSSPTMSSPS